MSYVSFGRKNTRAEALASTNKDKIFFPTDGNNIIIDGKEYGGDAEPLGTVRVDSDDYSSFIEDVSIWRNDSQKPICINLSDASGNIDPNKSLYLTSKMMQALCFYNPSINTLNDNGEAYYNIAGSWYSYNVKNDIKFPTYNMTSVKQGVNVKLKYIKYAAFEFLDKYINFTNIKVDNAAFSAYKLTRGYASKTDGEFIRYLILNGEVYSAPSNPANDSSITPKPLVEGKGNNATITIGVAEFEHNLDAFHTGEFYSADCLGSGIYSLMTIGRPAGSDSDENYILCVDKSGAQSCMSIKNPSKVFKRANPTAAWEKVELGGGVGKNTGGTGEIFNDYTDNYAHPDHGHAEGQKCRAEGYNAHAEGYSTKAGWDAHSEGGATIASGKRSHAEGDNTIANGASEHAQGMYNKSENNAIHSVGIGTGSTDRKNAHTILKTGEHYIYGIGGYDGTNIKNARSLQTTINYIERIIGIIQQSSFMPTHFDSKPGDILCSDMSVVRPVIAEDGYTVESVDLGGKTPIGVCIVPANHMDDGEGRWMSLNFMDCSNPDGGNGSSHPFIFWGGYGTNLSSLPDLKTTPNKAGDMTRLTNLGSKTMFHSSYIKNLDANDGLYYKPTNDSDKCPSPFNADGSINQAYRNGATGDFDGRGNTDKIIDAVTVSWESGAINNAYDPGNYPAACCCRRYFTDGTNKGDWYLPAMGELGYLMYNAQLINNVLAKVNKVIIFNYNFLWTSTEYDINNAVGLRLTYGSIERYGKQGNPVVRAFLAF